MTTHLPSSIKETKDKKQKSTTQRVGAYAVTALGVLAAAGAIFTLVAMPGLAIVAGTFAQHGRGRRYHPSSMRPTLYRLKKKGFIRVVPHGKELRLSITQKGLLLLRSIRGKPLAIAKPATWDRQWQMIAFDIPEALKSKREAFRNALCALGFRKLQKSLFVLPFPCKKELSKIIEDLRIGPYVHLITATTFNGEPEMRRTFGVL